MTIRFESISTNGIRLHTALAGPEDGEPVFLLHGFPDAWFGWESQIRPLVEAGFRVIELRSEWCFYSIDYLIERLLKTVFNNRDLARRMGAESRIGRWAIPINLFDVMYVVCRKR